jgi:hypothetical protein
MSPIEGFTSDQKTALKKIINELDLYLNLETKNVSDIFPDNEDAGRIFASFVSTILITLNVRNLIRLCKLASKKSHPHLVEEFCTTLKDHLNNAILSKKNKNSENMH